MYFLQFANETAITVAEALLLDGETEIRVEGLYIGIAKEGTQSSADKEMLM